MSKPQQAYNRFADLLSLNSKSKSFESPETY
jgi:hypothetical protein